MKLRILLYSQVACFLAWGIYLLLAQSGGRIIWLDTKPVDPRDLFSGHYVQLSYPAQDLGKMNCTFPDGEFFVKFVPAGNAVHTAQGDVRLSEPQSCAMNKDSDGVWGRARAWSILPVDYGIGRFYLSETSPLLSARSGNVVAKISVAPNGDMRIIDLVPKK
jgi:hypothetical protein